MTVYKPAGRFGSVHIDSTTNTVLSFEEKPDGEGNWINAGFLSVNLKFLIIYRK